MGVAFGGVGTLRFSPLKEKINSEVYCEILDNTYAVDCHRIFGADCKDYVFQQDGASVHTSGVSQERVKNLFPRPWLKREWPASSPDLNVLDYFVWGYLEKGVNDRKPNSLVSLKAAIAEEVGALPLEMVQKAIMGFRERVALCIEAEGDFFKHRLGSQSAIFDTSDRQAAAGEDGENEE